MSSKPIATIMWQPHPACSAPPDHHGARGSSPEAGSEIRLGSMVFPSESRLISSLDVGEPLPVNELPSGGRSRTIVAPLVTAKLCTYCQARFGHGNA